MEKGDQMLDSKKKKERKRERKKQISAIREIFLHTPKCWMSWMISEVLPALGSQDYRWTVEYGSSASISRCPLHTSLTTCKTSISQISSPPYLSVQPSHPGTPLHLHKLSLPQIPLRLTPISCPQKSHIHISSHVEVAPHISQACPHVKRKKAF